MADADLKKALRITGELLFVETTNEARLSVASQSGTGRVAFAAVGDDCPLCASLDGKVFRSDSADAARFSPPVHINCDCLWIAVGDDEVGATDDWEPGDEEALAEEIERHGHFITAPEKYQALRVPMGPSGRDFTFRRGKAGEPGTIEWRRPRYSLGDTTDGGRFLPALETGAGGIGGFVPTDLPGSNWSIERLEEWANDRFKGTTFSLQGADPQFLRPMLVELQKLQREWPEVMGRLQRVTVLDPQAAWLSMMSETGEDLWLNQGWWSDPKAFSNVLEERRRRRHFNGAPGLEALISEEYGHGLKRWIDEDPDLADDLNQWLKANPLPRQIGKLGLSEQEPEETMLHETFGRGIIARVHGAPSSEWLDAFNSKLDDLVERRRNLPSPLPVQDQ